MTPPVKEFDEVELVFAAATAAISFLRASALPGRGGGEWWPPGGEYDGVWCEDAHILMQCWSRMDSAVSSSGGRIKGIKDADVL